MNKIVLEVIGLSYSQSQSGAYALILGDKNSKLKLPIIIGSAEAQSIALAFEGHKSRRPLTHDLFKAFADVYLINIKEVIIDRFKDGIFYSQIVGEKDGETTSIDARASDAVALALRFGCPIYTNSLVMSEAGIVIEDIDFEDDSPNDDAYEANPAKHSVEELQKMLDEAVENEDFERASMIRDEILKIKDNRVESKE